jgi:hypothetical protein
MLKFFSIQIHCRKRDAYNCLGSSGTLEPAEEGPAAGEISGGIITFDKTRASWRKTNY